MSRAEKKGLALLTETLEIYGADRTRWPAQVRRELVSVLGESAEAQRLVGEAEALDRLLDQAPTLGQRQVDGLAERIAAATRSAPRVVAKSAPPARPADLQPHRWTAAATALAASLVLGLLTGLDTTFGPAIGEIAGLSESDAAAESAAGGQSALLPDGAEAGFDEELL